MRKTTVLSDVQEQRAWALAQGFMHARPNVCIDSCGYVEEPKHNLLPGVSLVDFKADLLAGAGLKCAD